MITHELSINVAVVHLRPPVELDGTAWLETACITGLIRLREVQELRNRTAAMEIAEDFIANNHRRFQQRG